MPIKSLLAVVIQSSLAITRIILKSSVPSDPDDGVNRTRVRLAADMALRPKYTRGLPVSGVGESTAF